MAVTYRTTGVEALDLICVRYYGRQAGAVERVLEENAHISPNPHCIPIGTELILPDLDATLPAQTVRLWD